MTTDMINNTINANKHNPEVVTDDISDGFHTFGQLYFQRMMLFATLVNLFPEISWKTKRHEDGEECFGGGWFLVTIDTPAGAYGYHYKMEHWDKFNCMELLKAKHWDGYTEENVDRLFSLVDYKKYIQKLNKDFSGFLLKESERQKIFNKIREQECWEPEVEQCPVNVVKIVSNLAKEYRCTATISIGPDEAVTVFVNGKYCDFISFHADLSSSSAKNLIEDVFRRANE